jgi:hypothetical protein
MGKSFVEMREKAIEIIRIIGNFLFAVGSVASASTLRFQAGSLRRDPRFLPSVFKRSPGLAFRVGLAQREALIRKKLIDPDHFEE